MFLFLKSGRKSASADFGPRSREGREKKKRSRAGTLFFSSENSPQRESAELGVFASAAAGAVSVGRVDSR